MRLRRHRLDPDLAEVDAALRRHRPKLSDERLSAMSASAIAAGSGATSQSKEVPMRFRIAVVSLLAAGLALSGGGAGLAVSGLAGNDDPATAQYGAPTTPKSEVLGGGPVSGAPTPAGGVEAGGGGDRAERGGGVQPGRQLASQGSSSLPFTGWATVPVILAGLMMLAAGLVLRRRTRRLD